MIRMNAGRRAAACGCPARGKRSASTRAWLRRPSLDPSRTASSGVASIRRSWRRPLALRGLSAFLAPALRVPSEWRRGDGSRGPGRLIRLGVARELEHLGRAAGRLDLRRGALAEGVGDDEERPGHVAVAEDLERLVQRSDQPDGREDVGRDRHRSGLAGLGRGMAVRRPPSRARRGCRSRPGR